MYGPEVWERRRGEEWTSITNVEIFCQFAATFEMKDSHQLYFTLDRLCFCPKSVTDFCERQLTSFAQSSDFARKKRIEK